ncbi:unnamed protein product [Arctia plantaginis]|uniref:Hyaluronidase n=1 Tax=Arctia plantaginis TaxID=874455 RepID=A0A8S0Z0L6_ARCPL|nr:unnamed protein product [Arctia plantaginis]
MNLNIYSCVYLAACAVVCAGSDQSYYAVQETDSVKKVFNVYWNVPTRDCKKHDIQFNDLYEKYGIIQNADDIFQGEKITILYNPGNFPGIVENVNVNGIVPQEGNLLAHLQKFKQDLEETIPDRNFQGIGVIDFENWRPILRQNFGTMEPIRVLAPILERIEHWWWPKQWIDKEAQRRFESSARSFLQTSLNLAKKLRPKALWGYYGFPECFNRLYGEPEKCPSMILSENDKLSWLWSKSTALFPSVYTSEPETTPEQLAKFIKGKINEAARVRTKGTPILPYFWFRYKDGNNLKQNDLQAALDAFYNSDASGFIIWGSYKDVINKSLCLQLKEYVTNILGPAVAKYTKPLLFNVDNISTQPKNESQPDIKPKWKLSEDFNSYIQRVVVEELRRQMRVKHYAKGSQLVDVILEKIAGYYVNNSYYNVHNNTSEAPVFLSANTFRNTSDEIITPTTSDSTIKDTHLGTAGGMTDSRATSSTGSAITNISTLTPENSRTHFTEPTTDVSKCSTTKMMPIANQSSLNSIIVEETNEKYYRAVKKGDISTFCQH